MEYIQLIGAETVSQAASSMRQAAEEMKRAASEIDYSLHRHEQFLQEWLQQFESILNEKR
jgi:hypothetical protein